MRNKYCRGALVIILSVGMMMVPATTFPESPSSADFQKNSTNYEAVRLLPEPLLRSGVALVEDQETGELLIQKQATLVLPIASITKLMTAMVMLDAKIDLQEALIIEKADIDKLRGSHSRLPVRIELSRRDALLIALMASDNRAAHALARTYPGGFEACIAAMNAKAKTLGLSETRFEDPTGLSSGNVSSARDLVRLVDAAYKYRLIREFTTCKKAAITYGRRVLIFHNTNRLVQNPRWEIGLSKTGFIADAGRCLVMQCQVAKRNLLIVLLDSHGKLTRVGDANRIKHWLEGASLSPRTRKG
jgi:serine-type D-Ala-D-Ala endopeptidase (penicillin-binding protein 7)